MNVRRIPDLIRRFSVLIALFWLGLAVVTNVFVPQLETVAESHNVSLSPPGRAVAAGRQTHRQDSTSSIPTARR